MKGSCPRARVGRPHDRCSPETGKSSRMVRAARCHKATLGREGVRQWPSIKKLNGICRGCLNFLPRRLTSRIRITARCLSRTATAERTPRLKVMNRQPSGDPAGARDAGRVPQTHGVSRPRQQALGRLRGPCSCPSTPAGASKPHRIAGRSSATKARDGPAPASDKLAGAARRICPHQAERKDSGCRSGDEGRTPPLAREIEIRRQAGVLGSQEGRPECAVGGTRACCLRAAMPP